MTHSESATPPTMHAPWLRVVIKHKSQSAGFFHIQGGDASLFSQLLVWKRKGSGVGGKVGGKSGGVGGAPTSLCAASLTVSPSSTLPACMRACVSNCCRGEANWQKRRISHARALHAHTLTSESVPETKAEAPELLTQQHSVLLLYDHQLSRGAWGCPLEQSLKGHAWVDRSMHPGGRHSTPLCSP